MKRKRQPLPIEEKTEAELAQIIDIIKASALPDYIKTFQKEKKYQKDFQVGKNCSKKNSNLKKINVKNILT